MIHHGLTSMSTCRAALYRMAPHVPTGMWWAMQDNPRSVGYSRCASFGL